MFVTYVADTLEDKFVGMGVNLLLGNCFVKMYEEEDSLSTHRDVSRDINIPSL